MARIRTIKPEFFTSDDVCALSPLARLLYIGLWCEADREGRMVWAPKTFRRRYLPDDDCDVEALCDELRAAGLIVMYGDNLAHIPTFSKHQHVNPREAASSLPPPKHASSRVADASIPDVHAQVGREGKEGEGREDSVPNGTGVPPQEQNITTVIFSTGLSWLKKNSGKTEPDCRALLGKWRKELGDEGLLTALGRAQREGALHPVSWMEGAIKAHRNAVSPKSQGFN